MALPFGQVKIIAVSTLQDEKVGTKNLLGMELTLKCLEKLNYLCACASLETLFKLCTFVLVVVV